MNVAEATRGNPRGLRYPGYADVDLEQVRGNVAWLRQLRERRRAIRLFVRENPESPQARSGVGNYVSYTNDPEWLVDMAVNRRAGWPDDPSLTRGSAVPVVRFAQGWMVAPILQYPKTAEGDRFHTLVRLGYRMNGTRVIIREREVPKKYRKRLAHRIYGEDDY